MSRTESRRVLISLAAVAGITLYGVLVGWLMLHGHLGRAVVLLVVLALVAAVAAVLQWRGGHRWRGVLLAVGSVVVVGALGGYAWSLDHALDDISRVDVGPHIGHGHRPPKTPTTSLNIVLMGADDPHQLVRKPSVSQLLADGHWDPGAYRSDTLMVVHVPRDRHAAYVVSIPRDSYVPLYDADGRRHGRNKITEAFSEFGPLGTWRTVENLSGVRLDHMAIIDYAGFRDLTSAVGGVRVYVPETVYDDKLDQTWTKGWHTLRGNLALKYVRMRHGLYGGDFDRIDRQQNFLRTLMQQVLRDDVVGNPARFSKVLGAITSHLTVDSDWSKGAIQDLALDLRGLNAGRVRFLSLPLARFQTIPGVGDANIIDRAAAHDLWQALLHDRIAAYARTHPQDALPDPHHVS